MMNKRLSIIFLLICIVVFALGLAHLFILRFDMGDVYPEYSSLRADPLGTMALCEGLERMSGVSVRRDFSAANQLPHGKETAYLHLAARASEWTALDEEVVKEIEGFVTSGGRFAVSFFPETTKPFQRFTDRNEIEQESKSPKPSAKKVSPPNPSKDKSNRKEPLKGLQRRTSLKERWGLELGFLRLGPDDMAWLAPGTIKKDRKLSLPDSLEWHSGIIVTNASNSWQTIYSRGTNPVVIERKFGLGTVVIATDSYFLSNEALRKDPQPALLSWWIGPAKHVVFDEAHFGLLETEGVAVLLRKYRLYGVVASLMLLAGLFIWKNSSSFLPLAETNRDGEHVFGKEAAEGFANLLRRNISKHELLNVCFVQWKKSRPPTASGSPARQAQAEAALRAYNDRPQRERDPVNAYREICGLLKKL